MINGWEFPSHVHHRDVGGSEPTQVGSHMLVSRPAIWMIVGPTDLLEGP